MKTVKVMLDTMPKVQEFVKLLVSVPYDVDLVSGRYTIDAKSLLGILSLDLSKPIELQIYSDDCAALVEKLTPYLA